MLESVNKSEAIVKAYVAIWNRHDLDVSENILDPNIVLYSPLYPNGVKGLEAHHEADVKFFKSMPDFQFKIERIAAKDDFVAAELTGTGTSTGPAELPGRPPLQPTGRHVKFQLGSFFRVNSKGLIEEEKYVYDRLSIPPADRSKFRRKLKSSWTVLIHEFVNAVND